MAEEQTGVADPQEAQVTLSKDLGLFDATMIGVGAMIGAGIFVLTGIAAGIAGPGLVVAFLLNGLLTLPTLMVYAELGSAYHDAGGGYLWIKDAMAQPFGFLGGWMSWFAHIVAAALYAVGFGGYFSWLLQNYHISFSGLHEETLIKVLAVGVTMLFTFINFYGVKETGKAENVVTILKLITLAMFIFFGLKAIFGNPAVGDRFVPLLPNGMGGVFIAMGLTFIAFEGYEIIAQSSEEVKNPKVNIPKACFYSIAIVVPIYLLVAIVALGAVNPPDPGMPVWQYLGQLKELAILEGSISFMPMGALVILVGGLLSTMSALNATIYSSSRVAFAMARDNNLPAKFRELSQKRRTPTYAIIGSSAIIAFMAVTLPIEDVAAAADVMFLLLFTLINLSIFKLRRTTTHLDYGFRTPWFPLVPILGIIGQLFLAYWLFSYSPEAWVSALTWIGVGLLTYYMVFEKREEEAEGPTIVYQEIPAFKEYSVLVPVHSEEDAEELPSMALPISKYNNGEVFAVHIVEVPKPLALQQGREFLKQGKPLLNSVVNFCKDHNVPVGTSIRLGRSFDHAVRDVAGERNADFLLINSPDHPDYLPGLFGNDIDHLLHNPPCDIGVLYFDGKIGPMKKILIPSSGSLHSKLAAEVAHMIVQTTEEPVEVHVLSVVGGHRVKTLEQARQIQAETVADLKSEFQYKIVEAHSVAETILKESKGYDLIIMGATRERTFESLLAGEITERIARKSKVPVMIVRKRSKRLKSVLKGTLLDGPSIETPNPSKA